VALRIRSVVSGLDATDLKADGRISVVRQLPNGASVIETPRYRAFTEILVGLAARGRDVVEIAGNDDVLVTILAHEGRAEEFGRQLFAVPVQSRAGWRRIGLNVKVQALAAEMRRLRDSGIELEHVYDY
jgi:hypothetical protein